MLADEFRLPIQCPRCRKVSDRPLGSLKASRQYRCESCGLARRYSAAKLASVLECTEEIVQRFRQTLN